MKLGEQGSTEKFARRVVMPFAEGARKTERGFAITISAARAIASNWSVTLAMALTTTTGFCALRPLTIVAARSMALASCTEVPPNFMTIIGRGTSATVQRS